MRAILQDGRRYLLRAERGEEFVSELTRWDKAERIGAASFTAIGAAGELILSYYHLDRKEYEDQRIAARVRS